MLNRNIQQIIIPMIFIILISVVQSSDPLTQPDSLEPGFEVPNLYNSIGELNWGAITHEYFQFFLWILLADFLILVRRWIPAIPNTQNVHGFVLLVLIFLLNIHQSAQTTSTESPKTRKPVYSRFSSSLVLITSFHFILGLIISAISGLFDDPRRNKLYFTIEMFHRVSAGINWCFIRGIAFYCSYTIREVYQNSDLLVWLGSETCGFLIVKYLLGQKAPQKHVHGPNCNHAHSKEAGDAFHNHAHEHVHGPNCNHGPQHTPTPIQITNEVLGKQIAESVKKEAKLYSVETLKAINYLAFESSLEYFAKELLDLKTRRREQREKNWELYVKIVKEELDLVDNLVVDAFTKVIDKVKANPAVYNHSVQYWGSKDESFMVENSMWADNLKMTAINKKLDPKREKLTVKGAIEMMKYQKDMFPQVDVSNMKIEEPQLIFAVKKSIIVDSMYEKLGREEDEISMVKDLELSDEFIDIATSLSQLIREEQMKLMEGHKGH